MVSSSEFYTADNSNLETKKLEAASDHYKRGNYSAALRLYFSLLNTSASYKLYYRIGKCFYKMNQIDEAREAFEKSVELESYKNPSYAYLATLCYKNEDLKGAIYNWASVFAYKPEDENVCLNLATSYFSRGMKFQSVYYYEKYLKYASEHGQEYSTIKTSIDKCSQIGNELLQKAKLSISRGDNKSAIELLNFAIKNQPVSFDINYLLGSTYLLEKDNMRSMIYLKQAYCVNKRSAETLQKLASASTNLGDYTTAYCSMKRLLPLVMNNQSEYLKTLQMIKGLESSFDNKSHLGHKEWGDKYFEDNNYHFALIEYENCILLDESNRSIFSEKIERLKRFIHPEEGIIESCMEKGKTSYTKGDYRTSNKYFSKVMLLSEEGSPEYKLAKSRVVNV
ncbi:tetratricopeptide repeat protein [bacterium]|nr:tetratricopeptide repeat protein [bacterium]